MKNPKLGASLLSIPNFLLQEKVKELYNAKIDFFHIDIMDGNFVPNLSISPSLYHEIFSSIPQIYFDLHFMVTEKALHNLLTIYLQCPPRYVTIHQEAVSDWKAIAQQVRKSGVMFGLAINPSTELISIQKHLKELDLVLLMSVVPGYGGQKFKEATYKKLEILQTMRNKDHLPFLIQIDGGINLSIAKKLINQGADLLVIGSDLVSDPDPTSYISRFDSL
jgi:ribulose-phosphate 3-epimerase